MEFDEVFFISSKNNPMNRTSIRHMVVEIGNLAGIRNVHPHRLRHTFASELAFQGASEFEIIKLLGQTSSSMATKYVHSANMASNRVSVVNLIKKK